MMYNIFEPHAQRVPPKHTAEVNLIFLKRHLHIADDMEDF